MKYSKSFAKFTLLAVLLMGGIFISGSSRVDADTAPPTGVPATVSADALPTVQINGIVWDTAMHGNTVYATGRFTHARPAGKPVGDPSSVTRTNLLAFDIRTGQLISTFNHSLTGGTQAEGRALAVSPDGKYLYVGGSFTAVDGQPRRNFAAIDLTTGSVARGFTASPNDSVRAVAATNTHVFIGGSFWTVGNETHEKAAAYRSDGSLISNWRVNTKGYNTQNNSVSAMTVVGDKLIFGGTFTSVNGQPRYSSAAVYQATGQLVTPWASSSESYPLSQKLPEGTPTGRGAGITSLSNDGTQVYMTGYVYVSLPRPNTFEGRAAINPQNGAMIWVNDCLGDSYDAIPIGKVLYSAGHAHDCMAIKGFPEQRITPSVNDIKLYHTLAETTYKTGVNGKNIGGNYASHEGQPRSDLLTWFPNYSNANVSGSNQAAWTVTGNASYLVVGGEFPTVNGKAQQGLVRYAISSVAPNKAGPRALTLTDTMISRGVNGVVSVRVPTTSDRDNRTLTYRLYRAGVSTPVDTQTVSADFWNSQTVVLSEKIGINSTFRPYYYVVVSDAFGNTTTSNTVETPLPSRFLKGTRPSFPIR